MADDEPWDGSARTSLQEAEWFTLLDSLDRLAIKSKTKSTSFNVNFLGLHWNDGSLSFVGDHQRHPQ